MSIPALASATFPPIHAEKRNSRWTLPAEADQGYQLTKNDDDNEMELTNNLFSAKL